MTLDNKSLEWLLEEDTTLPSARYLALRDLFDRPATDPELAAAAESIMRTGPVPAILRAQSPEGNWAKPGTGYSPKYRGTLWSVLILAELGAAPDEPRIRKACEYVLDHAIASNDAFSCNAKPVPSGAILCLNGNLLFAMIRLGLWDDLRVRAVAEWLAGAILGEGLVHYYESGTSGAGFACGINLKQPCGWGANKALRGLLAIPQQDRTSEITRALDAGAGFLLSRNPAEADYPYIKRVSSTWFKLGFPLSYWSDVLETAANLVDLGLGVDPRVQPALDWVESKRDLEGRWKLENSLNGKMWTDIERRGKPSKMVSLRVLRTLKRAGRLAMPPRPIVP